MLESGLKMAMTFLNSTDKSLVIFMAFLSQKLVAFGGMICRMFAPDDAVDVGEQHKHHTGWM